MAKRGPKEWEPDEKDIAHIESLAGQGLTLEDIAHVLGKGQSTFCKYKKQNSEIEEAIKRGKSKAYGFVTGKLFEQIKSGNLTAIIFYLKTQRGWKETDVRENTGKDGAPLIPSEQKITVEMAKERIQEMLSKK